MMIAEMKNQTFGVEIEMADISRQNAAIIAAGFFGTNNYEYIGNGYQTWVAYDAQNRPWQFERDGSIIANRDDEKCELVTPVLKYEDIETLQELIRVLRKAGAVSNPRHGCGVHIHVGANGHSPQTLRNLTNIMAAHEQLLIDAISIDRGRIHSYCHTVNETFLKNLNEKKPKTMEDLATVWYTSHNEVNDGRHYNSSRYHMLNLHATFTKGTIEFRLFQFNNPGRNFKGGLHAGQLKSYIQLCLAMSQAAKEARNASPKKNETDNPKYAMRCWLLRLGFIGDEFKTARDLLTRRLTGDAAFRYGRPAA